MSIVGPTSGSPVLSHPGSTPETPEQCGSHLGSSSYWLVPSPTPLSDAGLHLGVPPIGWRNDILPHIVTGLNSARLPAHEGSCASPAGCRCPRTSFDGCWYSRVSTSYRPFRRFGNWQKGQARLSPRFVTCTCRLTLSYRAKCVGMTSLKVFTTDSLSGFHPKVRMREACTRMLVPYDKAMCMAHESAGGGAESGS